MRSKWCKYVLSLAIIICSMYVSNTWHSIYAQQAAQPAEERGSDLEDLNWQLGVMEESAAKQQEQIQAIRERLDAVSAEARVTEDYRTEAVQKGIKHAVEDYLSTDEAR